MCISTVLSRLTALSLGIFSLMPVNGQQGDVWVNLLEQDDYALRTGTVRRVDRQGSGRTRAVLRPCEQDVDSTISVSGDLSLPISEIAEITFEQSLRKSSPAVARVSVRGCSPRLKTARPSGCRQTNCTSSQASSCCTVMTLNPLSPASPSRCRRSRMTKTRTSSK